MGLFKNTKALTVENYHKTSTPRLRKGTSTKDLLGEFAGTVFAAATKTADKTSSTTLRLYGKGRATAKQKANVGLRQKSHLFANTCTKHLLSGGQDLHEVIEHDFLRTIKRPNPFMSGRQYQKYTQLYLDIAGVVYHKLSIEDGLFEMYVLPAHAVKVEYNAKGEVLRYMVGDEKVEPSSMLVQVQENLLDPYCMMGGTSPVKAISDYLDLQKLITMRLAKVLKKGQPAIVLSPVGDFTDIGETEAERWRGKYRRFIRDEEDVLVLDQQAKVDKLAQNPTDMAVIQVAELVDEMTCRAFGMPLMILTGQEGGSRAAYQTALQEWADGGISARLRESEDFWNNEVLPLFNNTSGLWVAYDDPSPYIEELMMDLAVKAAGGPVTSVNEARSMYLGLDAKEGFDSILWTVAGAPLDVTGDEAPEGDTVQTAAPAGEPASDVVDSGGTPAAPAPEVNPVTQARSELLNTVGGIGGVLDILRSVAAGEIDRESAIGIMVLFLQISRAEAEAIIGATGENQPKEEPKPEAPTDQQPQPGQPAKALILPPEYEPETKAKKPNGPDRKRQAELQAVLKRHFRKWAGSVQSSLAKSVGDIHTKALPDKFVPLGSWGKDLAEDSQPVIELIMKDEGKRLLTRVGASADVFNVFNQNVKEKAKKAALNLADETLATTTKDVNTALEAAREAIAEGLEAGDSLDDLTKRIGEIFESAEEFRSERIAKTESARAHMEGLRDSAKESGVVKGFTWLASSNPCPICAELDGKAIDLDGDLPPQHPNCECALLENVEEV